MTRKRRRRTRGESSPDNVASASSWPAQPSRTTRVPANVCYARSYGLIQCQPRVSRGFDCADRFDASIKSFCREIRKHSPRAIRHGNETRSVSSTPWSSHVSQSQSARALMRLSLFVRLFESPRSADLSAPLTLRPEQFRFKDKTKPGNASSGLGRF